MAVRDRHDFRPLAAFVFPTQFPPFLAGAKVPSMNAPARQGSLVVERLGNEGEDSVEPISRRVGTLVDFVIDDVSRPVLDKTGFEQPFNFVLEFTPNVAVSDYLGPSTLPDAGPSAAPVPISTALQEQLGLQLRSTEGPVETIVIDRIERPSEN